MNERIRRIVELLPDGASVTFSKDALREIADSNEALPDNGNAHPIMPDMTIADIMEATGRARSTVHGWIASGALRAYDFGSEKRVTPHAWQEFLNGKRNPSAERHTGRARSEAADLGAWRRQLDGGKRRMRRSA